MLLSPLQNFHVCINIDVIFRFRASSISSVISRNCRFSTTILWIAIVQMNVRKIIG
jgi:hypothetical protein